MHKNKFYVPNSREIRKLILKKMHNVPYLRHQGYQKTLETIRKEYFWSGMKKDIAEYIARCMECQKVKIEHRHLAGLLQPLPIPKWKWEVVTIDFITKFPKTIRQNHSIMAVEDKLTKDAHFIPIKSTHKSNNIKEIYMK